MNAIEQEREYVEVAIVSWIQPATTLVKVFFSMSHLFNGYLADFGFVIRTNLINADDRSKMRSLDKFLNLHNLLIHSNGYIYIYNSKRKKYWILSYTTCIPHTGLSDILCTIMLEKKNVYIYQPAAPDKGLFYIEREFLRRREYNFRYFRIHFRDIIFKNNLIEPFFTLI